MNHSIFCHLPGEMEGSRTCALFEGCPVAAGIREALRDERILKSGESVFSVPIWRGTASMCSNYQEAVVEKPKRSYYGRREPVTKNVLEEQARLQSEAERAAKIRC